MNFIFKKLKNLLNRSQDDNQVTDKEIFWLIQYIDRNGNDCKYHVRPFNAVDEVSWVHVIHEAKNVTVTDEKNLIVYEREEWDEAVLLETLSVL